MCHFSFVPYHYITYTYYQLLLSTINNNKIINYDLFIFFNYYYYNHYHLLPIFKLQFIEKKIIMVSTTPTKHPSSNVMSLPFPSPKPPPDYPDLYGKRREMARVQMLEREISFLEEELKSSEGFQPSSKCCKEIADFVTANSDPLLPMRKKNRKSCCLRKWLRRMRCLNLSWICCWCCDCFSGFCNRKQNNCKCNSCRPSINCSVRNWCYCCDKKSHCCKDFCGCNNCCCTLPGCNFRWPFSSCCVCKCSCSCTCPSFPKFPSCCCCTKC
ncbi:guanine nucleotide-binding protein subunit gamma 3 [Lathyrus oleraceus]|uniref:G protein gamma domain-containing protein n=1 Tax=Pisum sativum TaxID=3888 RepID=A0A9D5BL62_PEA|nr:guanine nucleotide-binding protein subunit gamma 3-like [Pisum sativum]KAI5445600.1 hypothetical protein KIW84_013718 [Pisum sativum]